MLVYVIYEDNLSVSGPDLLLVVILLSHVCTIIFARLLIVLLHTTNYALCNLLWTIMHGLFILSLLELLYQFCQWSKFSWVYKAKLINEIDEMFETCVQMSLGTKKHNMLKVSMIDMCIHSKKPLEDDLYNIHEILGKWYSQSTWENFFVIKLVFNPCHQKIDVFSRTDF